MNYNSDFKYDLEIGKIGEEALGNLLSDQKIEVKTDFHLADTNNLAVEYASRGKYSGISTTEAEWFAFVEGNDQDTIILVKTDRLKIGKMIRKTRNKNQWKLFSKDGSKVLGTFRSKKKAQERERQIQYFKNRK